MSSKRFGIRVLLAVMCLFTFSKLSYETPPVENAPNEHSSELFDNSEVDNVASRESSVLSLHNTTHNTTHITSITTPEIEDRLFRWNTTLLKAEILQSAYCSRQCRDGVLVYPRGDDFFFHVKCFPCDCNKPLCEFYGTCCPDYHIPLVDSYTDFDEVPSITRPYRLNSNGDERNMYGIKDIDLVCSSNENINDMIERSCPLNYMDDGVSTLSQRSCPWNYPDSNVKSRCQDDIPTVEQDTDTFLHVTDNITGITYYNQNCATCNNVSHVKPWTLSVVCDNFMKVYSARTSVEFLRLSLASDSGCSTLQEPSDCQTRYNCDIFWFNTKVVDSCNATGEWDVYDAKTVQACADVSGLVNRVQIGCELNKKLYKNLFCAICNMKSYIGFDFVDCKGRYASQSESVTRLPFSVLLNFGSHGRFTSVRSDVTKCSQDSNWTSPENKCLPLQCGPGKILTNRSCSTALSQIRRLVYKLHIYYVPSVINYLEETYIDSFQTEIRQIISIAEGIFDLSISVVYSDKEIPVYGNQTDELVKTSPVIQIAWFAVDGFIISQVDFSRDELEIIFVSEFVQHNITIDINTNTTLTLMPVLYPQTEQKTCHSIDLKKYKCISERFYSRHLHRMPKKEQYYALMIEPHLNCAFVQFNQTQYLHQRDRTNPHSYSITLYFNSANITISERTELNMVSIDNEGTIRICIELLNTKILINNEIISHSILTTSLYILTLICIIASITCLTITLMTYFLFPLLRSVAGKNNMFLSASLLLAQISLLATSHVSESGHLCSILAISTHFLWLSMFCWCFTCCFHMFCIFSAKTRSIQQSSAKSEMMYMIKRVVACSAIPGLIVIGVITTNLAISGGQFIGYGNRTCFVDAQITLIITLVVPLCLILLFNFIFFSITVFKIYNVRKLQTQEFRKDDHNNLYIYIKLSSMTGIFWVLSVISEATDNDPLRFFSIGLNGLQGVFIFLSYTCNRRVLSLYLKSFGLEEHVATTSTIDRSTIAKVVAAVDKQAHICDQVEIVE